MAPEVQIETNGETLFCPECGAKEGGFFCRGCGTLIHGEDMVLCPRCHQVVPGEEFCNQCGQELGAMALSLRQLAMAGDAFWVTEGSAAPADSLEPSVLPPDESVTLAEADLPVWLEELPVESAPAEVEARIYPSLRPIEEERAESQQGRFLILAILLMGIMLLGMMGVAVAILLGRGG